MSQKERMPVKSHDLRLALQGVPSGAVRTAEEDAAAFPRLATFNAGAIYVGRFTGQSPWERHPDGDELLHVLEGEVEVTLLLPDRSAKEVVRAGCVLVVPRGVWHRQTARPNVTLLAATPDFSEASFADDPRTQG